MLESAIPEQLLRERKCPVNTPPNYVPPFPAYCARFPTTMESLVMATIGAQYENTNKNDGKGIATIKAFITTVPEAIRPSFWEVASVTDKRGAYNIAVVAYWPGAEAYQKWETESGFKSWWQSRERENEGHGWFQEILRPTVDRFETNFSNPEHPEGAANMQEKISGQVLQHGYWGSMRDRIAAAQDDELKGEHGPWPATESTDGSGRNQNSTTRVRVEGKKNLCVIRSGQDWSDTLPAERKLYLETMHPVLVTGMKYLRDEGRGDGCYAMNLWDVVDSKTHTADQERTFGLGYFNDMASLEKWSKSHRTHINIFGGFLKYAKRLNNDVSLRLFHEVYSLEQDQQFFEYVGCHADTGMRSANAGSPNGGCCLPGFQCSGIGCVAGGTSTTYVQPSTTSSSSTAPPPSSTAVVIVPITSSTSPSATPTSISSSSSSYVCSTGWFSCAASLGGGCCQNGRTCATGASCIGDEPTSAQAPSAPVRPTSGSAATTQSAQPSDDVCPSGFYVCSAYYPSGCCRVGRDCQTTGSCALPTDTILNTNGVVVVAPTGATVATTGAAQGGSCPSAWYSCAANRGGNCCPNGFECGEQCTATASGETGVQGKIAPSTASFVSQGSILGLLVGSVAVAVAMVVL